MENPTRPLTLFSVKGVIKSISINKIILEPESGGSIEIYVPNKFPCAPSDHVEITFEITEHGFIGRQVRVSESGQAWPILPSDFLFISEYIRFGLISLIGMVGFIIISLIFPVYFLSIIFPVFFGILLLYFWIGAFVIGKGVPNYNRATNSSFASLTPENYSQYYVKSSRNPLFLIEGMLKLIQGTPSTAIVSLKGRELPLIPPINPKLQDYNNLEGYWIVSLRKDQIKILGRIEREGGYTWILNPLLSMGLLIELFGYIIFFLSIIPGFFMYGLGAPVPFPGDLIASLFVTCLFVGSCLIIVGKIADLKKKRLQNNVPVDYKI